MATPLTERKQAERLHKSERVYDHNNLELLTGRSNPSLAHEVARLLHKEVDEPIILFADGEAKPQITHNLRRRDVFIMQSTSPPHVNDYYMELFLMIDAARRASAAEITVVEPYFGYARQDTKDEPRVSISASLMANILMSIGAHRLMTIDMHSGQAQGYVLGPWDNLYARFTLLPKIKHDSEIKRDFFDVRNAVVVGPDVNAMKRATKDAKFLETTDIAGVVKERDVKPNSPSEALFLIGGVRGKDTLLTDDIWATGRSMINASHLIKQNGAQRIISAVTHGLFLNELNENSEITWDALQELTDSPIEKVYVTDTIAHRPEVLDHPKIQLVSVAPLLAKAITHVHTGQGLKELFE